MGTTTNEQAIEAIAAGVQLARQREAEQALAFWGGVFKGLIKGALLAAAGLVALAIVVVLIAAAANTAGGAIESSQPTYQTPAYLQPTPVVEYTHQALIESMRERDGN